MNKRGHYIVFEGLDGSGKTTQFELLQKQFKNALAVREPGGTPMSEHIRTLLKDASIPRAARTNAFLFSAARSDLIHATIRPAIEQGRTVLSDRNWLSTVAYQAADGAPTDELLDLCKLATKEFFEPDLLIFLDVDVATARARLGKRGGGAGDYFERQTDDYFKVIRQAYLRHLAVLPRVLMIAGDDSMEAIAQRIQQAVSEIQPSPYRRA